MSSSTNVKKSRYYTGVSLEPEVSAYLDDLAQRMGMSRSWVLNTIVTEYAHFIEKKNIAPLASREAIIRL
jgi:predicted transcriptional regulator